MSVEYNVETSQYISNLMAEVDAEASALDLIASSGSPYENLHPGTPRPPTPRPPTNARKRLSMEKEMFTLKNGLLDHAPSAVRISQNILSSTPKSMNKRAVSVAQLGLDNKSMHARSSIAHEENYSKDSFVPRIVLTQQRAKMNSTILGLRNENALLVQKLHQQDSKFQMDLKKELAEHSRKLVAKETEVLTLKQKLRDAQRDFQMRIEEKREKINDMESLMANMEVRMQDAEAEMEAEKMEMQQNLDLLSAELTRLGITTEFFDETRDDSSLDEESDGLNIDDSSVKLAARQNSGPNVPDQEIVIQEFEDLDQVLESQSFASSNSNAISSSWSVPRKLEMVNGEIVVRHGSGPNRKAEPISSYVARTKEFST